MAYTIEVNRQKRTVDVDGDTAVAVCESLVVRHNEDGSGYRVWRAGANHVTLVRTAVDEISVQGRNTQGVRLIRLSEGERLVGIERIESLDGGDEGEMTETAPEAGASPPTADS